MRRWWLAFAALVLLQIGYPLAAGRPRAALVAATVILGFSLSVGHAVVTRGLRTGTALVGVAAAGGLAVETLGVATGFPFGGYAYSDALGPRLWGVPALIPLAWAWMAWPAWLAAGTATRRRWPRTALAGLGLAAWDLLLDPQMVAEGYWHWRHPDPHLPGVPDVPLTNYLGWLAVAVLMMALFPVLAGPRAGTAEPVRDRPVLALYVWTYAGSVLALAVFLGLPAAAGWGAVGMAPVALPAALALCPS
ncbi:MAG TPA: carotenoid biosynthesis protein [Rugosimonospora sp.]|nr:carotenoid biosynthesis protein [Rugosimonospora sp.]